MDPMADQVINALELPEAYEWTAQGFGMIRTYLDENKRYRLNIWHSKLRVPNVSTIHDHPWSFISRVFAGELKNTIYDVVKRGLEPTHSFYRIKTGEDGGPLGDAHPVTLQARPSTFYFPGDQYAQRNTIIHETDYRDGTVTLNDRTKVLTPNHSARVFFPFGTEWVDAKPRPATAKEIEMVVKAARLLLPLSAAVLKH